MNKELYHQIIDEAYENFSVKVKDTYFPVYRTKDEFIDTVKNYPEFSKKWGIQIEERELSLSERYDIMKNGDLNEWLTVHYKEPKTMEYMDKHNIPKQAISLTYNNETITVYV